MGSWLGKLLGAEEDDFEAKRWTLVASAPFTNEELTRICAFGGFVNRVDVAHGQLGCCVSGRPESLAYMRAAKDKLNRVVANKVLEIHDHMEI
jgi:hypothetical protein